MIMWQRNNRPLKKHVESTSSSKNIIGIQRTNRSSQWMMVGLRIRRTFATWHTRLKKRKENREEWQQWRTITWITNKGYESITLCVGTGPVQILKKMMSLSLFLTLMYNCDLDTSYFKEGGEFARDLVAKSGTMVGKGKSSIYVT